jgi:hypothetical protein
MSRALESYIPVRKPQLAAALAGRAGLEGADGARFMDLAEMLAAVFHYERFAALEALKEAYAPLDPDEPGADAREGDPAAFLAALQPVLDAGDFREHPAEALLGSARTATREDVHVRTQDAGIRRIRFFMRGARTETIVRRRLWGLLKKTRTDDVHEDVVLIVELKGAHELGGREAKAVNQIRRGVRPGAVLLKHFGAVPASDLVSLHPGATPTMKRADQLMLGVPAIAGGAPLLLQLVNAAPVIFAVIAAIVGAQGVITQDAMRQAIAALSGVVALGAFFMRQRLKFDRQRLLYQKRLADTVYFHTVANNAGVLDGLVGAAEAQDVKEALLAWAILRARGPLTGAQLDKACEGFLSEQFGLTLDFQIGDALAKLQRLRLVGEEAGRFMATPAGEALARLDEAWDGYFPFSRRAEEEAPLA